MKTWNTQQPLCIFCSARQYQATTSTRLAPIQSRSISSITADRSHLSKRRRDRDRDRDRASDKSWKRDHPRTRSNLDVIPSFKASRPSLEKKSFPSRYEFLAHRVKKTISLNPQESLSQGLEGAYRLLTSTSNPVVDGLPKSKQELLDPENKLWHEFTDHVTTVFNKPNGLKGSESENRLRAAILDAIGSARPGEHLPYFLLHLFYDHIFGVTSDISGKTTVSKAANIDLRYPTEWYASARQRQRVVHLHVGPTNSGKTYNALKRLQEAKNGFYAGPLRLLAHEVFSRFTAAGVPCNLITGDDVRVADGNADDPAKVYASTMEMVDVSGDIDVAVIDEVQLIAREDRGWAWTRAFLGARAKEVHLCGEVRVIPLIKELTASVGDALKIHRYERLNPLVAEGRSLRGDFKQLRKGDAVVSFSIVDIHALKKRIEKETGRRVAIVYGSLPPETRAKQAELFNDPNNDYDYLVASDAIGMGLNLSIKRIIFQSLRRFNGQTLVQLTTPEIRQIAGRAGRYRSSRSDTAKSDTSKLNKSDENVGLVTCLDEVELPIIHSALRHDPEPIRQAGIVPTDDHIVTFAAQFPKGTPFEYILRRLWSSVEVHPRYRLCNIDDTLELARVLDSQNISPALTTMQCIDLCNAPNSRAGLEQMRCFRAFARAIARREIVGVYDELAIPLEVLDEKPSGDREYLGRLENLHKCMILWLWLSYRFSTNFIDRPTATYAKELTEQRISETLQRFSANKKLELQMKKLRKQQEMGEQELERERLRYQEQMGKGEEKETAVVGGTEFEMEKNVEGDEEGDMDEVNEGVVGGGMPAETSVPKLGIDEDYEPVVDEVVKTESTNGEKRDTNAARTSENLPLHQLGEAQRDHRDSDSSRV